MYLFRPPYGAYDNDVIKTAYAMHYYPIQWSVDSLDWKNYGVDSIITTVCNHKALAREPLSSVTMEQSIQRMHWMPC